MPGKNPPSLHPVLETRRARAQPLARPSPDLIHRVGKSALQGDVLPFSLVSGNPASTQVR